MLGVRVVRRGGDVALEFLDIIERHVETEPGSLEYTEAEIRIRKRVLPDVGDFLRREIDGKLRSVRYGLLYNDRVGSARISHPAFARIISRRI